MAHRNVDGTTATRWSPRISSCLTVDLEPLHLVVSIGGSRTPNEEMLRDSDRTHVEPHARVARDAEQRGMQSTMAVNHQDVGALREPGHNRFDSGEFTVRKVRWHVRECDSASDHSDLHRFESVDGERHGDRERFLSPIRDVDSGNAHDWFRLIGLDHLRSKTELLLAKVVEETKRTQGSEDPRNIDAAVSY